MTNTQAVQAEIRPYTIDSLSIEKALTDTNLNPDAVYTVAGKANIAKASIAVLKQLLSLISETEGGYSQGYDPKALESRISQLEKANGLAASVGNLIRNRSMRW